jgi:hypothetical protein
MAFRIPIFRSSTTVSDEGYKVTFVSWEMLRYQSNELSLDLFIEVGGGEVVIERNSFRNLNSEASKSLTDDEVERIFERITGALEWRGWKVREVL